MRKGWRNDVNWLHFFCSQRDMKAQLRQQERAAQAAEDVLRVQQKMHDDQERHNAECHAKKVAAGEIPLPRMN